MKKELTHKIKNILENEVIDEQEILKQIKNEVLIAESAFPFDGESTDLRNLIKENLDELRLSSGSTIIKTGLDDLDKFVGFLPGEFVVIGGRPAMGKTMLMVSLALEIAKTKELLYFSFELSKNFLASRFLAALSAFDTAKIMSKNVSEEELGILSLASEEFAKLKILVSDSCSNSISSFKAYCAKMIAEKGVKVIIVDYIQLMSSNRYSKGRDMELGYISRELKNIAKENNVCVIAASQLNRSVESRYGDKRPILSDLRDSGNIEQDADKVIFIHRPEYYGITTDSEGNSLLGWVNLIVAKNRSGATGDVLVRTNSTKTRIIPASEMSYKLSISDSRLKEIEIDVDFDSFDLDTSPF